jgi:hypothetical protein
MTTYHYLLLLTAFSLVLFSCKKDKDDNEQELITTVELHFTGPGIDARFKYEDLDGPGGNAPVIDTITLPANTADLNCFIHVYDRSKNPAVDITDEILEEDKEHLFVFGVSGPAAPAIVYADADGNGAPLGVRTKWTTGQMGLANVRVTLYHEPSDKGNLGNPGGEVDVDVTFPVLVQ